MESHFNSITLPQWQKEPLRYTLVIAGGSLLVLLGGVWRGEVQWPEVDIPRGIFYDDSSDESGSGDDENESRGNRDDSPRRHFHSKLVSRRNGDEDKRLFADKAIGDRKSPSQDCVLSDGSCVRRVSRSRFLSHS